MPGIGYLHGHDLFGFCLYHLVDLLDILVRDLLKLILQVLDPIL